MGSAGRAHPNRAAPGAGAAELASSNGLFCRGAVPRGMGSYSQLHVSPWEISGDPCQRPRSVLEI